MSDPYKIPFERVISVYNRAGHLLTEDRQILVPIAMPQGGVREEPFPDATVSEPDLSNEALAAAREEIKNCVADAAAKIDPYRHTVDGIPLDYFLDGARWAAMSNPPFKTPFPGDAALSRDIHAEVWANYVNAVAASEPRDPFKAYPVPFLGQTSPDPSKLSRP